MKIRIPTNALVILVGPSGSGKSSFAKKHFSKDVIVSSDNNRRLLHPLGQEALNSQIQDLSEGAFILTHAWVRARLRHNLLTVADTTALRRESREELSKIAESEHCPVVYLWFDTPFDECRARDEKRDPREKVPENVLKRQFRMQSQSMGFLKKNAYRIRPGDSPEITYFTTTSRSFMPECPVDVIGDVHGCYDELVELVESLGYKKNQDGLYEFPESDPAKKRVLAFVGDLVDRGPEPYKVLDFVKRHVEVKLAYLVLSNHDKKLASFLSGNPVRVGPELRKTIDSIPEDEKIQIKKFLFSLPPYLVWGNNGSSVQDKWVIVHAAFKPKYLGKSDKKIRDYCVYGPNEGVNPETGLPIRIAWWENYRFGPNIVYGHYANQDGEPRINGKAWNIDGGCVHGGSLIALRLPEKEFVKVKAKKTYMPSIWPPKGEGSNMSSAVYSLLEKPVLNVVGIDGQRETIQFRGGIKEAIWAVSTRTISPRDLVWLAPNMSPGPVSDREDLMEDPVVSSRWLFDRAPRGTLLRAETKHMGSRGTWSARKTDKGVELACWTRKGYEMFDEPFRSQVFDSFRPHFERLLDSLKTDLVLVDSEIMPWNQHGPEWLERTFSVTAAAGHVSRFAMANASRIAGHPRLAERFKARTQEMQLFGQAINRYCWPVDSVKNVRVGFFDILYPQQTQKRSDTSSLLKDIFGSNPLTIATDAMVFDDSSESLEKLFNSWKDLTEKEGKEGVVLKYEDPTIWAKDKFPQRMLKVRGKDYLRIVYGPRYLEPSILQDLKRTRREYAKMRMAYKQNLLGDAALKRIAEGRPWEDIHVCVLGIMASDRAIVDPRL